MSRPAGTVTFLLSDIEGSTQRWERDREAMSQALQRHDALMRESIEAHGGYVFKVVGDSFYAAFATASDAVSAAVRAQRLLSTTDFSSVEGLRVRMALHTGDAERREDDYFGPAVNRVARLLAIGHGGQVLVSGTTADLLDGTLPLEHELRDLGMHGLKDLSRAERVFQLHAPQLGDTFPALRSLDALPNNLPVQLTSFVGREDDVRELASLLERGSLVTVAGPGGVGKTRCALQAGANLLETFRDGAWLVDLAPLADASLVASTIAATLRVRAVSNRSLLETLVDYLAARQLLLILDNCEHVLSEARSVAAELLRRCPNVRIIATSREPLNVAGEQVLRLPSLDVPESIALFTDRARSAGARLTPGDTDSEAVTAIVTRLDGMPLAIELAAARTRVLSPAQIAARLDERFRVLTGGDRSALPRRQTLRATIDWSYDLLDERERALFRRLSIFAGTFDLAAATAIGNANGELDELDVLDLLAALVDKSLVLAETSGEERRYRLLQSIREYGLERLHEAGEQHDTAARHARYYARFAQSLVPLVDELEDELWKHRAVAELDNIRTAIDWTLVQEHDPAAGIALLANLEWPEILTTPQETLRWYERAAQEVAAMPNETAHARILRHVVVLAWLAGTPLPVRMATAKRAVEIAKNSSDPDEIARALANLGACYPLAGEYDAADAAFAEAYRDAQRLARVTRNTVLRTWAAVDVNRGNMEPARERFRELAHSERSGSEAHASAMLNLGELEFLVGSMAAAREAAGRARETYAALGSPYLVLVTVNLAAYALAANDLEDARKWLREALDLRERLGRWLVNVLDHHALLAALQGNHADAAALIGFTDEHYRSRGEPRQETERRGRQRLADLLAKAYDASELQHVTVTGASLSEEQALAIAAAISNATSH